jgi:hypothetical protein
MDIQHFSMEVKPKLLENTRPPSARFGLSTKSTAHFRWLGSSTAEGPVQRLWAVRQYEAGGLGLAGIYAGISLHSVRPLSQGRKTEDQ